MRIRVLPTLARLTLAVLVAGVLVLPSSAQAQDTSEPVLIPGEGTELFRALLDQKGITPVQQEELWPRNRSWYDDVMVIVLGPMKPGGNWDISYDPLDIAEQAVRGGCPVLFATDHSFFMSDNALPQRPTVQTLDAVVTSQNPEDVLNHSDCPYAVPLTPRQVKFAPEPDSEFGKLFAGLNHVATNRPAPMLCSGFAGRFQYALAGFPPDAEQRDQFGRSRPLPRDAVLAIGGYANSLWRNDTRFLTIADHSIFTNQMLIAENTENWIFTNRVIEFLQGPEKRTRCLFLENGRVVDRFDGLRGALQDQQPPIGIPPLSEIQEKLVDLGNAMISKAQERNFFNRMLTRFASLPSIVRFVLILVTLYAMWYLLKRFFSSRKPTDIPAAPTVAGVAAGPPGVFDRRQKELLRRNNVYEPARDMVREFFISIGIHGEPGPKPPPLMISKAIAKPESLRKAVKDFWKLAYGPPKALTVSQWEEMAPYLERLRQAHADGKWRFE